MEKKKVDLKNLGDLLSRNEMRNIMAGYYGACSRRSGDCTLVDCTEYPNAGPQGETVIMAYWYCESTGPCFEYDNDANYCYA